jgi:hypothetical protein
VLHSWEEHELLCAGFARQLIKSRGPPRQPWNGTWTPEIIASIPQLVKHALRKRMVVGFAYKIFFILE